MIYGFYISSKDESTRHQKMFFRSGFIWAGGESKVQHVYRKWLYINTENETITFSDDDIMLSEATECKLLHPKQQDFLNKHSNTCDIVQRARTRGYYQLSDAEFLNDLLNHKIRLDYVKQVIG
jgi:hypothetical protein